MTSFRSVPILVLTLVLLLLASGCTSQPQATPAPVTTTLIPVETVTPDTTPLAETLTIITEVTTAVPTAAATVNNTEIVPVTTITETPAVTPNETATLTADYHPEYIRMDATTYKVGEVVEFYLMNKGTEIKGCDYAHPVYTIQNLQSDGTRNTVSSSDPARSSITVISESEPGSATGPFTFNTANTTPGRYLIRFDCGNNIAREFEIQ